MNVECSFSEIKARVRALSFGGLVSVVSVLRDSPFGVKSKKRFSCSVFLWSREE